MRFCPSSAQIDLRSNRNCSYSAPRLRRYKTLVKTHKGRTVPTDSNKRMEIVSRSWIAGNLEKYKELLERRPAECPVCYESFAQQQAASPLLSDIPSRCTHFLCKACWQNIAKLGAECPICREDLRPWLAQESDNRLTNEQVQKFLVSVMCIQGGGRPIMDASTMLDISQKLYNTNFLDSAFGKQRNQSVVDRT